MPTLSAPISIDDGGGADGSCANGNVWSGLYSFTSLPDTHASVWGTATEVASRLVHCGANASLTGRQIEIAIHRRNRWGAFMAKRRTRRETYYRPAQFTEQSPDDQRDEDGAPRGILPRRNWFVLQTSPSIPGLTCR